MEGCHRVFTRHTQCLHEGVHLSLQVSRNLQQLCLRPCAKLLLPRNISRVKVLFHQNIGARQQSLSRFSEMAILRSVIKILVKTM